jgi:hypothetical protein
MVQACCRLLMDSFNNKCAILKIAMHCGLTKENKMLSSNLVPRAFLVVARELRKTLVKYDEISKILGDLSHAQ